MGMMRGSSADACSAERSRFSGPVSRRRLLRMLRETAGLDACGAGGTTIIAS